MFEYAPFSRVDGDRSDSRLQLISLSTCGFCKSAKKFLDENGFSYEFIDVDKIDAVMKKQIKDDYRDKFGRRITFPCLVIDEDDYLVGFIRHSWVEELGA